MLILKLFNVSVGGNLKNFRSYIFFVALIIFPNIIYTILSKPWAFLVPIWTEIMHFICRFSVLNYLIHSTHMIQNFDHYSKIASIFANYFTSNNSHKLSALANYILMHMILWLHTWGLNFIWLKINAQIMVLMNKLNQILANRISITFSVQLIYSL